MNPEKEIWVTRWPLQHALLRSIQVLLKAGLPVFRLSMRPYGIKFDEKPLIRFDVMEHLGLRVGKGCIIDFSSMDSFSSVPRARYQADLKEFADNPGVRAWTWPLKAQPNKWVVVAFVQMNGWIVGRAKQRPQDKIYIQDFAVVLAPLTESVIEDPNELFGQSRSDSDAGVTAPNSYSSVIPRAGSPKKAIDLIKNNRGNLLWFGNDPVLLFWASTPCPL